MNLPISLVKTWLELSTIEEYSEPELKETKAKTIHNILHYFGNFDIAEHYINSSRSVK